MRHIITYSQIDNTIQQLAYMLNNARPKTLQHIKAVAPVLRGGLIPAAMLSYATELRLHEGIKLQTRDGYTKALYFHGETRNALEETLIVDDIVDSGLTLDILHNQGVKYFTSLTTRRDKAQEKITIPELLPTINIDSDAWVVFPWEVKKEK